MMWLTLTLLLGSSPLGENCVALVGSSDVHGSIEPFEQRHGEARVSHGGLLAQGAYIVALRAHYGERLVWLDGGDIYQGTLVSNLNRGEAMIAGYNQLGLTAAAIGNHEFDYGPLKPTDPDRLGVVKARAAEAQFPLLAINIYERATHRPIDWPGTGGSHLVDAGGVKVGIIGVATVETPRVTKGENVITLEFVDPVPLIVAEARSLRARGAQVLMLVGHVGGHCQALSDPNDLGSCDPDQELFQILRALPPGTLHAAVGGHTHRDVAHMVHGVVTIQAGSRARTLSRAEVCVTPRGELDTARTRLLPPLPLCLQEWNDPAGGCGPRSPEAELGSPPVVPARFLEQPVEPPAGLVQLMEPYRAAARREISRPLQVVLSQPLTRDEALGQLVAEAMRLRAKSDFAVQNHGGVRADLPAGALEFGQVYEVLPFGNLIGVVTVTGEQLVTMMRNLWKVRGKPPHLAGLVQSLDGTTLQLADGRPIDPEATYTVATSDFLAKGGEGMEETLAAVGEQAVQIFDTTLREALIALLQERFAAPSAQP